MFKVSDKDSSALKKDNHNISAKGSNNQRFKITRPGKGPRKLSLINTPK